MKNKSRIYISLFILAGVFAIVANSCKEDEKPILSVPVVSTSDVTDINLTSASCGGNITSIGSSAVITRGVCWSTNATPTITSFKTSDGSGIGNFTSNVTGLTLNTKYYIRAYATSAAGTGYGDIKSFTTLSEPVPVISTSAAAAITPFSAGCGGNITLDNGFPITERGVCWSKGANPTITDSKTSDGSGTGSFTSAITGLAPITKYYARAYATNSKGTGYGNIVSFTTKDTFIVSTTETNCVAVLETFGGVRCQYCPDGYDIAQGIFDANPGKFIIISVQGGMYAEAASGWPNFTTPFGNALISQAKVDGYPAGTVNRLTGASMGVSPQQSGGSAINRDVWGTAANFVMSKKASVNIGTEATFNSTTRLLTVNVYLYYTSEVTGSNNINVALLQDKLKGKQMVFPLTDPVVDYEHNNVLRTFITGQWGDVISATGMAKSSILSKSYTYTVPADYNGSTAEGGGAVVVDNLKVVVFVTKGQTTVLNALSVDVK